jgi:hypothetical protein
MSSRARRNAQTEQLLGCNPQAETGLGTHLTAAATPMGEKKVWAHWSHRVAMRRQSQRVAANCACVYNPNVDFRQI